MPAPRTSLLLGFGLLLAAALVFWFRSDRGASTDTAGQGTAPAAAARAAPVVVMPAVAARDDVVVQVVGSALAASAVVVHPAAAGEVARIAVRTGEQVKEGQLLVQLVDRNERLAVQRAQARRDAARRLLQRYENTQVSGAVPARVIDEARLELRQAELERAQAEEALRERAVRAPFAGVVGIPLVERGARVTPTTELLSLDDRTALAVSFEVPEPYLARLRTGMPLQLSSVAYPGRIFSGELAQVDSRVAADTRTVTVRARVPNEDDLLRPGMSFSVRLPLPGPDALRVGELAVQWGREGSHLWVVRQEQAARIPVRVIRRSEGAVLVTGELQAGEAVVVEGFHRLRPGGAVRIVQEREAPAAVNAQAQS